MDFLIIYMYGPLLVVEFGGPSILEFAASALLTLGAYVSAGSAISAAAGIASDWRTNRAKKAKDAARTPRKQPTTLAAFGEGGASFRSTAARPNQL